MIIVAALFVIPVVIIMWVVAAIIAIAALDMIFGN